MVAEAALKAKVDTNLFGDVASQMGLDAEGASELLDQLTVASQGSGVSIRCDDPRHWPKLGSLG